MRPTAFETVTRTLGNELGEEELFRVLHMASEHFENFESLFGRAIGTERERWIVGFLSGHRYARLVTRATADLQKGPDKP